MRRAAFGIAVDVSDLDRFANNLGDLTAEQLGASLVDAINETADSAYDLARKNMLRGINLTDEYVQRKMQVDHATESKPSATITAFGITTSLSHYGAMQLLQVDNWTNDRIQGAGHKFGSIGPGGFKWTKRTGRDALGIPVDMKSRGKSVEVIRGQHARLGSQFSIPGKKDSDGNLLIFRRKNGQKGHDAALEVLAGPSVYQLFRVAAGVIEGEVADNLESAVVDIAERQLKKAME